MAASRSVKIVGLAGGVASGKSAVARQLAELGAFVFDADAIAHQVLRESATIVAAVSRWGEGILDATGQIDRGAIAARVFAGTSESADELRFWESVTHPRITELVRTELERLGKSGKYDVIVLDAPLLFKAGWDRMCDKIIFVDADLETRRERAEARGWSREQFRNREASQLSVAEKRRRASIVIDNSGGLAETYDQVQRFWNCLSE